MVGRELNCTPGKREFSSHALLSGCLEQASRGLEQGFQRCFSEGLNQSLVSSVAQANHRINIYYASTELELRFSGNHRKHLSQWNKIDGEIFEAEQKIYASFRCVSGLGYMTVPEMPWRQCTRMIYLMCLQCFLMWYISLEWYLLHCILRRMVIQYVAHCSTMEQQRVQ